MNMLLHGPGTPGGDSPIITDDSLKAAPGRRWSMCLANPPFERTSPTTFVTEEDTTEREPPGHVEAFRRLGVALPWTLRPAQRRDSAGRLLVGRSDPPDRTEQSELNLDRGRVALLTLTVATVAAVEADAACPCGRPRLTGEGPV